MNPILDLQSLCRRLESAQASQNQAMAEAQARRNPATGARCERIQGAFAVCLGPAHPMNQGLALGLDGPFGDAELDALEAVLGDPAVLELSAGAEPGLPARLSRRGYRIRMFQQVWLRDLETGWPDAPPGWVVRPIRPEEASLFASVALAGFSERDDLSEEGIETMIAITEAQGTTCFLAWRGGEPAGAGTAGLWDGVAALSGTAVLPRFRGRGGQGALIHARLAYAEAHGCSLACSATLPYGHSQFNLQKMGFRVAYPKLELVKE